MSSYKHTTECQGNLSNIIKTLESKQGMSFQEIGQALKEKGQFSSTFTESDVDKCIRAHSEYFILKGHVVFLTPIWHHWPFAEMEMQAARHLVERLQLKKIKLRELHAHFDRLHVPKLTNYLHDGFTSVNEKLLDLLKKYYEYFIICDGYLIYNPAMKIAEKKPSSNIYHGGSTLNTASAFIKGKEITALKNLFGIVDYAEDTYGVIVTQVFGRDEFVYFDRRIATFENGRLYSYYPPGTYVTLDAILSPPDQMCKWRATKVCKGKIKSQEKASVHSKETGEIGHKQDKQTGSLVTMNTHRGTELAVGSQKDKQVKLMESVTQEKEKALEDTKRSQDNITSYQKIHEHVRASGQKPSSKEQTTALNKDQETMENQLKEIEDRFGKITEERNSILREESDKKELRNMYILQREKTNDVDLAVVQVKKRYKDTETMLDKLNEKQEMEIVQLKKDLKDVKATITELRTKLEHSERQQIDLKTTVTELSDQLKISRKEQSNLEKTVTALNTKMEQCEIKENQTKSRINELKAELNILVQEKNHLKMQIGCLQTALKTYDENRKESLKIHIGGIKKEEEQMKRSQRHLQHSLENLREKLQTSELEHAQQREQMI